MSNDSSSRPPRAPSVDTRFTPDSDATRAPAEDSADSRPAQLYMWCSDCRAAMRTYYYVLDTRPLCQKCKAPYAAQQARGSGPGSLTRVLLYGGGAALACALLLGILVLVFGFLRVLAAVGIGYAVARAVNHASGSYFDTKYRIIAAAFTYFALGLGSLAPVFKAIADAPDRPAVVASSDADETDDAVTSADEDDEEVMDLDELTTQMEEDREAAQAANREKSSYDRQKEADAQELASKGFFALMGTMLVMALTLPLLANFAWGLYAGVIGGMAIIYGVYKAWELTGKTVAFFVTGPYRVGSGPIPPTNG